MSGDRRPSPRKLFVEPDRQIGPIYFYTSSIEKYLQARLVFGRHGLEVGYFRSRTDPYDEDYSGTSETLLVQAIGQVTEEVGRAHIVFVEDTSLRLEALSQSGADFPGMRVKEWFARMSFEACDRELRDAGSDRRAVVKSDVALKVPGLARPVLFHGETRGHVVDHPRAFRPNSQYPWLTPRTFNGWFVPEGCSDVLGAMALEESWHHDFRVKAFSVVIERLEEYAAALNLPSSAYRRRRALDSEHGQGRLFEAVGDASRPVLAVIGRTCAGKSTFGEYASGKYGLRHIEASSIVRVLSGTPRGSESAFESARRLLIERGADVVVRTMVEWYGADLGEGVVVTGLRDIEELLALRRVVPRLRVILVDASLRTRFERQVSRGRGRHEVTFGEFKRFDSEQEWFGVLPVAENLADVRIVNEGKMEAYHQQIEALFLGRWDVPGVEDLGTRRGDADASQLYRCLRILRDAGRALDCGEIEARSAGGRVEGVVIRRNNANKVLKAVPRLARRLDKALGNSGGSIQRVRYEITAGGTAYLELVEWVRHR